MRTQQESLCELPLPQTLTLITTLECTAACKECCFQCSPEASARMSAEAMTTFIDMGAEAFPGMRAVVFSGGECFLLGQDLVRAVAHARAKGMGTRCISNGYWATSPEAALRRIRALVDAGLSEVNFSTGDAHQAFVPWERVVEGAITAAECGMLSLISVEACQGAKFTIADADSDPRIRDFRVNNSARERLITVSSIWEDFGRDSTTSCSLRSGSRRGCSNLFDTAVLLPTGTLLACCGLTGAEIPEMRLGQARSAAELRQLVRGTVALQAALPPAAP